MADPDALRSSGGLTVWGGDDDPPLSASAMERFWRALTGQPEPERVISHDGQRRRNERWNRMVSAYRALYRKKFGHAPKGPGR